jgi:putative transposase
MRSVPMISVLVSLVASFGSWVRSRAALQLELLALRHQLQVLNRSRPQRLQLATAARCLWAWLSRSWPAWRPALVIVKPETVIAWHRRGVIRTMSSPNHSGVRRGSTVSC